MVHDVMGHDVNEHEVGCDVVETWCGEYDVVGMVWCNCKHGVVNMVWWGMMWWIMMWWDTVWWELIGLCLLVR